MKEWDSLIHHQDKYFAKFELEWGGFDDIIKRENAKKNGERRFFLLKRLQDEKIVVSLQSQKR